MRDCGPHHALDTTTRGPALPGALNIHQQLRRLAFDQRDGQCIAVWKVLVQRADTDASAFCDRIGGAGGNSLRLENASSCFQNGFDSLR